MRGEDGDLIIEELMEDWPEDDKGIRELKDRVLRNKYYRNFLVSEDGQYTTVVVRSNAFPDYGQGMDQDQMLADGFEEDEGNPIAGDDKPRLLTEEQNSEFVVAIQSVSYTHLTLPTKRIV